MALLAIFIGMGASMSLIRLMTWSNNVNAETILDRVMEARSHLPQIVEIEEPLVIAFGSSMTEAGFSPRQFDSEMADMGVFVTSFNFGFGGLNPYFQDYFSRRIRDAFLENDRRLSLAMVEFTPLQNTKARFAGAQPLLDAYVAMLGDSSDVFELALEDPTRGIRVANIKYFRDEVSAEAITWHFGREIFGGGRDAPTSGLPPDQQAMINLQAMGPELDKRFEEDYPDYVDSDWSWEWQGGGTIPEERSYDTLDLFVEYYEALRNEPRMADDRLWRIHCCDIEDLDFEEELIAGFIRTVENFKEFSDVVEVVLLPRNHDWIGRPPEAEARLAAVLERIASETGVRVRSFEDAPEITPEMFRDTTHLARYIGDVPFTSLLVDTYAPMLK